LGTWSSDEKKNTDKYAQDTKKALGVTRPELGLAFYAYAEPPQEQEQAGQR
jgi:hypothetical protein